ncbi:DUF2065 domain-containing protein [Thiofilum flexile]|uniref:DUF2065 domain-containing protein n=1 Tax=Thiofilum flexile TaxID=125627 RepID=UPI0003647820|nr:DUF2065 domain-containing protein [Thiofilum flexile]
MIDWQSLLTAIALLLIIEGLLPFISPGLSKKTYTEFLTYSEKTLRLIGLASIIAGILLLFLTD